MKDSEYMDEEGDFYDKEEQLMEKKTELKKKLKKTNVVNSEKNTAITMMPACYCSCHCSTDSQNAGAYNANLRNISTITG